MKKEEDKVEAFLNKMKNVKFKTEDNLYDKELSDILEFFKQMEEGFSEGYTIWQDNKRIKSFSKSKSIMDWILSRLQVLALPECNEESVDVLQGEAKKKWVERKCKELNSVKEGCKEAAFAHKKLKFKISFHSPLLSNSKVINTMKRLSKESEDFEKLLENYISETDKERNKKKEYIEKISSKKYELKHFNKPMSVNNVKEYLKNSLEQLGNVLIQCEFDESEFVPKDLKKLLDVSGKGNSESNLKILWEVNDKVFDEDSLKKFLNELCKELKSYEKNLQQIGVGDNSNFLKELENGYDYLEILSKKDFYGVHNPQIIFEYVDENISDPYFNIKINGDDNENTIRKQVLEVLNDKSKKYKINSKNKAGWDLINELWFYAFSPDDTSETNIQQIKDSLERKGLKVDDISNLLSISSNDKENRNIINRLSKISFKDFADYYAVNKIKEYLVKKCKNILDIIKNTNLEALKCVSPGENTSRDLRILNYICSESSNFNEISSSGEIKKVMNNLSETFANVKEHCAAKKVCKIGDKFGDLASEINSLANREFYGKDNPQIFLKLGNVFSNSYYITINGDNKKYELYNKVKKFLENNKDQLCSGKSPDSYWNGMLWFYKDKENNNLDRVKKYFDTEHLTYKVE